MTRGKVSLVLVLTFLIALAACAGGGGSSSGGSAGSTTVSSGDGGSGTLTLAWAAPATNADGSQLTNLAGYKVHYGTASGNYTDAVDVGLSTGCSINSLGPGTYYVAVTAYNSAGAESGYSNEVSKTIQ